MSATMHAPPEHADVSATPSGRTPRRFLVIVGATLLVGAVMVAAAWLLLRPAGPENTAVVPAAEPAAPPVDGAAEAELSVAAELPSFEPEAARDPFSPVVPEPVQSAAPTDPAQAATLPEDSNDQQPADTNVEEEPGTAESPGDPVPAGCTIGVEVVCDGQLVELLQIRDRVDGATVAVVQVGTSMYEAEAGTIVVEPLELLDITATCARLRYGGSESFELCTATDALK